MNNTSYAADKFFDAKHARRILNENKTAARLNRLDDKAEELIGELCVEGKKVYYINLLPLGKGKILKGSKVDLTQYLIRNKYV